MVRRSRKIDGSDPAHEEYAARQKRDANEASQRVEKALRELERQRKRAKVFDRLMADLELNHFSQGWVATIRDGRK